MEAAHVKDAVTVLRILENPHDEVSWFRLLRLVEGIGPAGARRLIGDLGIGTGGSPFGRLPDVVASAPATARPELSELAGVLSDCAGGSLRPAAELDRARAFLEPVIEKRYEGAVARLRDLDQLEHIASRAGSRSRLLADLTLDPPTSTSDLAGPPLLDEDYVVLSTIHSAKGGEWDVVHAIHAADGIIPSDMATGDAEQVEEERRLFYVALTRARDTLYVYFPLRYYRRPRGLGSAHVRAADPVPSPARAGALRGAKHVRGTQHGQLGGISAGRAKHGPRLPRWSVVRVSLRPKGRPPSTTYSDVVTSVSLSPETLRANGRHDG